jgi:perosamine synthetase
MNNKWRFVNNEIKYLRDIISTGEGSGTTGDYNNKFENLFSKKVGANYAVTFNSGTGTLQAGLNALGVGYGDEVITTPLTVISNIYAILALNAVPVFADINKDTFNIDPDSIKKKISNKTKAIMPVALYGLSCEMFKINELSKIYKIPILLDAAEAHMAEENGVSIAKLADITSYSTENSKHISTGDGGIVVTDNEFYAKKMRQYGSLGYAALPAGDGRIRKIKDIFQNPNYKRHDSFGYNFRMPEFAAAIGLAQTEHIEKFVNLRIEIAKIYLDVISNFKKIIKPQRTDIQYKNTYWTLACKLIDKSIPWEKFREKFISSGGESMFAAWTLLYNETFITSGNWKKICPPLYKNIKFESCKNAEEIQPYIIQLPTNLENLEEAKIKADALHETLKFFS